MKRSYKMGSLDLVTSSLKAVGDSGRYAEKGRTSRKSQPLLPVCIVGKETEDRGEAAR